MSDDRERPEGLEFGPSGYLPERASKRARKIVLRAPLGSQWIVGSIVAGVVLVVAGVLFLLTSGSGPQAPWEPVAEIAEVAPALRVDDLLLVPGAGRVRAFADAGEATYCEASNRLESPAGEVWSLTGRGLAGTASLEEHPTQLHEGTVYVDPTVRVPGPPASDEPATPGC
ncbi:MAG: hypothetical protein ACLFV0_08775 [Nitriliruptoraceae bacterium]